MGWKLAYQVRIYVLSIYILCTYKHAYCIHTYVRGAYVCVVGWWVWKVHVDCRVGQAVPWLGWSALPWKSCHLEIGSRYINLNATKIVICLALDCESILWFSKTRMPILVDYCNFRLIWKLSRQAYSFPYGCFLCASSSIPSSCIFRTLFVCFKSFLYFSPLGVC